MINFDSNYLKVNRLKINYISCHFLLESLNQDMNDSMAFLFSLKNPTNNPSKLPQRYTSWSRYSVRHYTGWCPLFGYRDFFIGDHANISRRSRDCLGYTYTVPSGKRCDPFLTGNNRFLASEIETFYETKSVTYQSN